MGYFYVWLLGIIFYEHSHASFCVDLCLISLGYVPASGMGESNGNCMYNVLRNYETVFRSGHTILQSHLANTDYHLCYVIANLVGVK